MTVLKRSCAWLASGVLLVLLLSGCATNRVDWASRVGSYTYDQALLDYGPPDKTATLSDGRLVVEWLTRKGYAYTYSPFAYGYYYPYAFSPYYPGYYQTLNSPDYYLRLVFDSDQRLTTWKKFAK